MDEFLVVGSGSAGRRHSITLRQLFPSARISLVKRSNSKQPLDSLVDASIEVKNAFDLKQLRKPKLIVIASPATLHFSDLEALATLSNNFLIEKPLAANATDAKQIANLARLLNLKISVGYHLRFSDTPQALKEAMERYGDGNIELLKLSYGQHLRFWRRDVAAENSVTANKSLGGGVLRELSHEIDAVSYITGQPVNVLESTIAFTGAPTDGIVETSAAFTLKCPDALVRLHLDMTSDIPYRHWDVEYKTFLLRADLLGGTVTKIEHDGTEQLLFGSKADERDRAARDLLMFAATGIHQSKIEPCSVEQGVRVLNIIEAVEESATSGKIVSISE
jgi:predicted dehydrogenase